MTTKKVIRFVGGPLDGKTQEVEQDLVRLELDQPPPPEDIHGGEVPVAFFPPFHKYVYEESPAGSGTFVYQS